MTDHLALHISARDQFIVVPKRDTELWLNARQARDQGEAFLAAAHQAQYGAFIPVKPSESEGT